MSDTTRNETVATDEPPVRDTEAAGDEAAGDEVTRDEVTASEKDTEDTVAATDKTDDKTDDEPATPSAAVDDDSDDDDSDDDDSDDDDSDDDDLTDEDEDDDEPAGRPLGLVIALGAVAAIAVIALAVTALLYPGFLLRPGSPDGRAAEITTALATKDGVALDGFSCRTPEGQPLNPLTPDALTLIQSAAPAGPAQLMLDTQARVPIDLTLSAQGQTQTLPADVVLGVTDGNWCMTGLTQRQ